jgi:hypothetical protein
MRSVAKHRAPLVIDPAARAMLAALLAIDPLRAAAVRDETPSRRRPLRQHGASATYGEPRGSNDAGPDPGE